MAPDPDVRQLSTPGVVVDRGPWNPEQDRRLLGVEQRLVQNLGAGVGHLQ